MDTTSNAHKILIANPGAGKTERLSEEVLRLISNGVKGGKILCVTFTIKAKTEMEDRVLRKLQEKGYNGQLPRIETFHSYCNSMLNDFDINHEIISERLSRFILTRAIVARDVSTGSEESLYKDMNSYILTTGKVINAIKLIKSFGILPKDISDSRAMAILNELYDNQDGSVRISKEEASALLEKFLLIFRDYEAYKKDKLFDYQDLLILALDILKKSDKEPFEYILVDEVQDISALEREIIERSARSIFAVGDAKQAIFGFQGGNIESFNAFRNHKAFEREVMMHTYRLPQKVVEYVISFFNRLDSNQDITELQVMKSMKQDSEGKVEITISDNQEETAVLAVKKILKRAPEEKKIGILVRSNYQASRVSELMKSMGVDHNAGAIVVTLEQEKSSIATFIMGILSDEKPDVIKALYSEYSGVTLRDAIHTVDQIQFKDDFKEFLPEPFASLRNEYSATLPKLLSLFTDYILPRSLEMGQNHFMAARELYSAIPEFFEKVVGGKRELISFLKQENSEEDSNVDMENRVTISTVHKAKGREFDYVIYVPSRKSWADPSGMDLIMNSILRSKEQHYDPEDRREEENRIDFVALTRTKGELWIITKRKEADRYKLEGLCEVVAPEDESPDFISMSSSDAKNNFSKQNSMANSPWLLEFIGKKIKKLKRLSFSMIGTVEDLPSFITRYVLGISDFSTSLQLGTDVHKAIEDFLSSGQEPGLMSSDVQAKSWANFKNYYSVVNKLPESKWLLSEGTVQCNVKDLFKDIDTNLTIMGKIDAGYRFTDGNAEKIRIVDFKTSKEVKDNLDSYYEQISLYSYIYSLQNKIPLDRIEGEIVMLSIREGKISTGKVDLRVFQANPLMISRSIESVKKRIEQFVEFQNNPEALCEMILKARERYNKSELFRHIQEEISAELSAR
ncbi:MAG: UvrD-helicase domain-containing protein [Thermoplasmataceae archaeon]